MTQPIDDAELREKLDDLTARLHPTGELDVDNKPIYQEARLPLSMLDELSKFVDTHAAQAATAALKRLDERLPGKPRATGDLDSDYIQGLHYSISEAIDQAHQAISNELKKWEEAE